ncbi:hypothetical protein [Novosphingobium sp. 1748]|uniref:hypothetical protein n=2 Tax=Novosphingobium TaxID=165696 RepID=UPI000A63BF2D|nr:hypothetical protein [Novosphingobium sp. 1748]
MSSPSRNARTGAVALALGAASQMAAGLLGRVNLPWAYAGWLLLVFGALCLCDELGARRPLNRAGIIMLEVGFAARTVMLIVPEPLVTVRAELTFVLSCLLALLLWSVALMHRSERPKAIGMFGTLLSGGGLAMLAAAHIAVAGVGYLGFADLFAALRRPDAQSAQATITLCAIMAAWASAVAGLMWTGGINGGVQPS